MRQKATNKETHVHVLQHYNNDVCSPKYLDTVLNNDWHEDNCIPLEAAISQPGEPQDWRQTVMHSSVSASALCPLVPSVR